MVIWKPIPSTPGYEASSLGEIRNVMSGPLYDPRLYGRIKTVQFSGNGYGYVSLSIDGRMRKRMVAKLVCEAFHGPAPSPRHQAAHGDGNRTRNVPSNLSWKTPKDNIADKYLHGTMPSGTKNPKAKLTDDIVADMRRKVRSGEATQQSFIDALGVSSTTVRNAIIGKTWKHVSEPPYEEFRPRTLENTSCSRGHEYTEKTRIGANGARICNVCAAEKARSYRARQRQIEALA